MGIKWLLSLLIPGAGFIKAIMAIKDVIVFFVESGIILIPALIEAILALAAGSAAGVAKAIEFGLAKLIPLVIESRIYDCPISPAREQGDSFCLNKPLNGAFRCE